MFIVLLDFLVPLPQVDAHLEADRQFLEEQYRAGYFLASGPRVPRTGGVILARAASRDARSAVLAQDPFSVQGLARYDIIEFTPTKYVAALAELATPMS